MTNRETNYLAVAEVVEIHAQVMRRTGSQPAPLRSEDLLESAVMKAQAVAYYGGADLSEQAANLAIGISQNQPFLDGNKRTAYAALWAFLRINEVRLDAEPMDIAQQLEGVAERSGALDEATAAFAQWLRERVRATDSPNDGGA